MQRKKAPMKMKLFTLILSLLASSLLLANDKKGRLGVGMTNQLANNLPAISFKLQKTNSFAIGGVFALSTADPGGGYGAGLKAYRLLFDEPQLTFYASALGALLNSKGSNESQSGFQFDFTLGSEFSFSGLNSIGLNYEFGFSLQKMNDFVITTTMSPYVLMGIHFYL